MRSYIFLATFVATIFIFKWVYTPESAPVKAQTDTEISKAEKAPEHPPLGLLSKKKITKNIEKSANVWEEVHSVKGGLVKIRSIRQTFPTKLARTYEVKHFDLNGKLIYSRIASTHSNSITIYRSGKNGKRSEKIGAVEVIDFKDEPSEECLKNRYKIYDMPKACKANVKIMSNSNSIRLKLNTNVALIYDKSGKHKRILASDADHLSEVKKHIRQVYKETKLAKPLKEPII